MIIERSIARFVVFEDDSVLAALTKISANKTGLVLVVSENGHLTGMVTDGDVRRWMLATNSIDLEASAATVANKDVLTASIDAIPEVIAKFFSDRIRAVPLVDGTGRLRAVALPHESTLMVGNRQIGPGQPCFIIAEIGNNHNGDVAMAKHLVDLAIEAGADCAKFQMRDLSSLYSGGGRAEDESQDLGAQYTLDLLARFNLSAKDLFTVFDYCRAQGMEPLCTPWDLTSLHLLEDYGVLSYKIASADLTNHELLEAAAKTGKPLFCSTGMARESEIAESVKLLRHAGAAFCLLHTNSTYPAPFKDINLRYMDRLAEIGTCPVGYSGHERGWAVPVAAVARGACVVEKHFTVDRGMEGNDHKVSLLPEELRQMVQGIRATEAAMGTGGERAVTQGEMMNREVLAKSLHASVDIPAGATISRDMILVQSPGQGLQPNRMGELVGRVSRRAVKKGTPFFPSDLQAHTAEPRTFYFNRPWGLPVRWHDFKAMLACTNMDLVEYHLSYKDMETPLEKFFGEVMDVDLVVHAPELFAGDHILDLAASNDAYRQRSIQELQKVIDLTRALQPFHGRASVTPIVTNMGGFTTQSALPGGERAALYRRMEHSLAQLDTRDVKLIPQTMPPFPWHFGGQSYHNLFIDPHEIVDFCERNQMQVCLDVSHSQLACNHYQWSMKEFCELVAPYTAHLHLVDARGVDDEGLQIGDGMIDFAVVAEALNKGCPNASFVPEIWQGHKDGGVGFWTALDRLERWFGGLAAAA